MNTDRPVVIIWDGLNGRRDKSWVLWKQHESLSTTKNSKDVVEEQLQSLLRERGWSLTGKEGRTMKGSRRPTRSREPTEPQKVNMGERHRTKVGREEVSDTKIGGALVK